MQSYRQGASAQRSILGCYGHCQGGDGRRIGISDIAVSPNFSEKGSNLLAPFAHYKGERQSAKTTRCKNVKEDHQYCRAWRYASTADGWLCGADYNDALRLNRSLAKKRFDDTQSISLCPRVRRCTNIWPDNDRGLGAGFGEGGCKLHRRAVSTSICGPLWEKDDPSSL